jgi:hypothetical protein
MPSRDYIQRRVVAAAALLLVACGSPTAPAPTGAEFLIEVVPVPGERFVLRTTDPDTIRLAEQNMRGLNIAFPLGPLRRGDGGFNAPWTWHMDPSETRLVEAAIEVCDGRPSYVERNQADYPTYCPWGARVISRRR